MTRQRRTVDSQDSDRGAALVMVLVVVTVVALAAAAMLSLAGTSIRTTVALRDQAAAAYAAEGAAQVAISEIQSGTFPSDCATLTGDDLSLGNGTRAFYQSGSIALNAYVSCVPDPSTAAGGAVNSANRPANAIWTVLSDYSGVGQDYNHHSGKTIKVSGGSVVSENSIDVGNNTLAVTGTDAEVLARWWSGCITSRHGDYSPTACQPYATIGPRPTSPPPTAAVQYAPAPVCTRVGGRTYAAFSPGLYTDVDVLNGRTRRWGNQNECGDSDVVWFMPGTYYFDFTGTWNAPSRLIGGTPTDAAGAPIANLSAATLGELSKLNPNPTGACVNPRGGSSAPGVEFVFGGSSKIDIGSNTFELCATYSATSVPIAIYGLTSDIGWVGGWGSPGVSQQVPCWSDSCAMLTTESSSSAEIHIQGFVYAPNGRVTLSLEDSSGQVFNWGLLLGSFSLNVNGTSPAEPFVEVPPNTGSVSYSVMYLSVWTCPAAATSCDHAPGSAQLTAKVQVVDPSTVKVLSWSARR